MLSLGKSENMAELRKAAYHLILGTGPSVGGGVWAQAQEVGRWVMRRQVGRGGHAGERGGHNSGSNNQSSFGASGNQNSFGRLEGHPTQIMLCFFLAGVKDRPCKGHPGTTYSKVRHVVANTHSQGM